MIRDDQIRSLCRVGRSERWTGDGAAYDLATVRKVLEWMDVQGMLSPKAKPTQLSDPSVVELYCGRRVDEMTREERAAMRREMAGLGTQPVDLPPIQGDQLPKIGETVWIKTASNPDLQVCAVTGFYAWEDLGGDPYLHRIGVRLSYVGTSTPNARNLCDLFKQDGSYLIPRKERKAWKLPIELEDIEERLQIYRKHAPPGHDGGQDLANEATLAIKQLREHCEILAQRCQALQKPPLAVGGYTRDSIKSLLRQSVGHDLSCSTHTFTYEMLTRFVNSLMAQAPQPTVINVSTVSTHNITPEKLADMIANAVRRGPQCPR